MERGEVFDLLEDASQEQVDRLENLDFVTRYYRSTDDGFEDGYALTEPGKDYFGIE